MIPTNLNCPACGGKLELNVRLTANPLLPRFKCKECNTPWNQLELDKVRGSKPKVNNE